jgi:hypothetical protein
MNVFVMQIDYVKTSCKEDVHIYHADFAKKMERNLRKDIMQRRCSYLSCRLCKKNGTKFA